MTASEQLAKLFADELCAKAEREGDFFVDYGGGKVSFDGMIDCARLAQIALDFDPEEEP